MENASKALIMAGGILIALIILGALLLMFNNLSTYQNVENQNEREAQVIKFNNQYETYIRDKVRGNDIISLMNKIVDYNERKGDNTNERFQKMTIEISNIDPNKLKYDKDDRAFINRTYTEKDLQNLLEPMQELEKSYQFKNISNLSSNISKVMDSEEEMKELIPKSLTDIYSYEKIKEDTKKYYQYSQFKRVYFDCIQDKTEYSDLGRIIHLEFKCTNKMT